MTKKVSGVRPHAEHSNNPKHRVGITKAPLSLCPLVASVEQSLAHYDGGMKYGFWNWRVEKVNMRIYLEAARRHIDALLEGEDIASDSGVRHEGHIMACMAILLDARSLGQLIDDRPLPGKVAEPYERAKEWIAERNAKEDPLPTPEERSRTALQALNDSLARNFSVR